MTEDVDETSDADGMNMWTRRKRQAILDMNLVLNVVGFLTLCYAKQDSAPDVVTRRNEAFPGIDKKGGLCGLPIVAQQRRWWISTYTTALYVLR